MDRVLLVAGLFCAFVASISIYRHMFSKPASRIENDPSAYQELSELMNLTTSVMNSKTGMEYVSRDLEFDRWLRSNDLQLKENKQARQNLFDSLRLVADDVENIVRTQFWAARNRLEKQFSDDKKICLSSTPRKDIKTVSYFFGSYYASFVTNEFSTKLLSSMSSRPRLIRRGFDWFPVDSNKLKSIENSLMGNHIGIGTIGFTVDKYLVFWRQSYRAMVAEQSLVCTGAGSLDASDLDPNHSLKLTLANGMEREFLEESSRQGKEFESDPIIETRITGFYRWVSRGGKPEFAGVTKLRVASHVLEPNDAEVEAPDWIKLHDRQYEANNIKKLLASLQEILSKTQFFSVSAWMAALCLKEAVEEDPKSWQNFLEL